jgi:outer membrane lipoprotein-sorting protein
MTSLRHVGRLLAAAMLAVVLPHAAEAAVSAQDQEDIARAEAYLNGISTLKARFLQVAPSGATAEGTAYLSRPGRMRLDYDPPSPVQVVADGRFLIYYDKELEQTSYLGLNDTPAGILVRPNVRLTGGDVRVVDVDRSRGLVHVSLIQAKDPGAGTIMLTFTDNPFELKQWRVRDGQGQITTVQLYGTQTGVRLDPKLFRFVEPSFRGPTYRD